jgi:hypothetical protein
MWVRGRRVRDRVGSLMPTSRRSLSPWSFERRRAEEGGDGLDVSEDVGEVPASEFKPESSKRRGVANPKEEQLGATRIEGEGRRGGATTAPIGKSPGSATESTSRPNWRSSVMYPDIDSWSEAALELCEPFLECPGPSNEEKNAGVLGVRGTSGWT